jgi:hypothetical protein
MPLIMERNRHLVALMALAVNASVGYSNYFVMIPTGPNPSKALTEGFFELAAKQSPQPESMAILAADAPFLNSRSWARRRMRINMVSRLYRTLDIRSRRRILSRSSAV